MHYIRYDTLYTYVLLRVQHWPKAVREDEEKLLESVLKAGDKERAAAMKRNTQRSLQKLRSARQRSVSYTHLDVYKRQGLSSAFAARRRAALSPHSLPKASTCLLYTSLLRRGIC